MSKIEPRKPEDMIKELLSHGTDWIGILAVARQARGGSWYSKTKELLQEQGLMPKDPIEIKKQRDNAAKMYRLKLEEQNRPKPKKK